MVIIDSIHTEVAKSNVITRQLVFYEFEFFHTNAIFLPGSYLAEYGIPHIAVYLKL